MRAEGIPELTYALFCKHGAGDDAENAGPRELGRAAVGAACVGLMSTTWRLRTEELGGSERCAVTDGEKP